MSDRPPTADPEQQRADNIASDRQSGREPSPSDLAQQQQDEERQTRERETASARPE